MLPVEELVATTRNILGQRAISEFDDPIELASGQMSRFFVDAKAGLSRADDLRVACLAIHAVVKSAGIEYDAVGGLTLGADHLCVGVALASGKEWFIVRKEAKKRGTARRIEGAQLEVGRRVLVVEDVVSTGGSLFSAIDAIVATGAEVVAACTLVDRGDLAEEVLKKRGIPYFAISSFLDFGMPPVVG
ncbi:MAG: orotate phosphoribosyltransferase [Actinobacteria bacterium]|uniref:orotate phosphoribosyltransferase n=1 Tax=hydrothermal vent metagenome TaxID=652676 RepID=A0A3B0SPC9_9ZZZZ|nr:orotate phosphoribosyltransferase [Actinomycetota bacterium]